MKRLVWLLLAVFCTALAQVQPVAIPVAQAVSCPCCDVPGECGMPDCGLPPTSATTGIVIGQPAQIVQIAARRIAARPRQVAFDVSTTGASAQATSAEMGASARAASVLPVPLFKAHCSFLI